MAIQLSSEVRNAMIQAWETALGASPLLRLYSGNKPARTTDARTGTLIAEMALPADFMSNPANGSSAKQGVWQDLAADNAGKIGYYALMNNAGTICHDQGTVTATGGGGDMTVDNIDVVQGQQVVVNTFTRTMPNANPA